MGLGAVPVTKQCADCGTCMVKKGMIWLTMEVVIIWQCPRCKDIEVEETW